MHFYGVASVHLFFFICNWELLDGEKYDVVYF